MDARGGGERERERERDGANREMRVPGERERESGRETAGDCNSPRKVYAGRSSNRDGLPRTRRPLPAEKRHLRLRDQGSGTQSKRETAPACQPADCLDRLMHKQNAPRDREECRGTKQRLERERERER